MGSSSKSCSFLLLFFLLYYRYSYLGYFKAIISIKGWKSSWNNRIIGDSEKRNQKAKSLIWTSFWGIKWRNSSTSIRIVCYKRKEIEFRQILDWIWDNKPSILYLKTKYNWERTFRWRRVVRCKVRTYRKSKLSCMKAIYF